MKKTVVMDWQSGQLWGHTEVQSREAAAPTVAWRTLKRWMNHLEGRDELIRISRPVDVVYEAGAITDLR